RVDVQAVVELRHAGPHLPCRVLHHVSGSGPQLGRLRHPAHDRVEIGTDVRTVLWPADHVATADVEVVTQPHRGGLTGEPLGEFGTTRGMYGLDRAGVSGGQHGDLVAGLDRTTGYRACVATETLRTRMVAADHVLHRQPGVDQVTVGGNVDLFELVQQRCARVPGHFRTAVHEVVAASRGHRYDGDIGDVEFHCEPFEIVADLFEPFLGPVHQVHFVDAHHDMRHAEQ